MTRATIKAMFKAGDLWHGVRTDKRFPETREKESVATRRTVLRVRSNDVIFAIDGEGHNYYMPIPKASEVVEARPGFLHFTLLNGKIDVQLTREGV